MDYKELYESLLSKYNDMVTLVDSLQTKIEGLENSVSEKVTSKSDSSSSTELNESSSSSGTVTTSSTEFTTSHSSKNITSVIVDSGTDIYFDYEKVKSYSTTISDVYSSLNTYNRELQSLLTDLGNYWKGTLKDAFVETVQDYIDFYNKYFNYIQKSCDKLNNASKSYSDLDSNFASKEI